MASSVSVKYTVGGETCGPMETRGGGVNQNPHFFLAGYIFPLLDLPFGCSGIQRAPDRQFQLVTFAPMSYYTAEPNAPQSSWLPYHIKGRLVFEALGHPRLKGVLVVLGGRPDCFSQ